MTVHLAVAARSTGVGPQDVEDALRRDRTLVTQLTMRSTLFAFGRVRVVPRRPLPTDAARALDAEADRLTAWLDGVIVPATYRKHQVAGQRLP